MNLLMVSKRLKYIRFSLFLETKLRFLQRSFNAARKKEGNHLLISIEDIRRKR